MRMEFDFELDVLGEIVKCSVLEDRYGGAYSDAQFTAFALPLDDVPLAVYGGDCDCEEFWRSGGDNVNYIIGKGELFEIAAANLYLQLLKQNVNRK